MRRSVSACLACLMLGACSTVPEQARRDIIGLSRADLISCAGVPDQSESRDDQEVLVWKIEKPSSGTLSLSMPFDIAFKLSSDEMCHVVATVRQNRVSRLVYTGSARTWEGKNAACAPVVRACVRRTERSASPETGASRRNVVGPAPSISP